MKMKASILILITLLLIIPNVYAKPINYTCFFDTPNATIDFDVFGYDEYSPYLVEHRRAIVNFSITVLGNWSVPGRTIRVKGKIDCYEEQIDENLTISCGIPPLNKSSYRDSRGDIYTNFRESCDFRVPLGSKYCWIYLEVFGVNYTEGDSRYCKLTDDLRLPKKSQKKVITESEYLTKRMLEISREQTNISKRQAEIMDRQANISQQQKQAMDTSNLMIMVAAVIGVLGAVIGAKIGADRTIKGSFKLHGELSKKERMKNVAESVCLPLREIVRENSLKEHLDAPTEGNWEKIEKYNPYFEFLPTQIQEKLKDYFDQLKKQKEIFNDLSNDIGRLFHKIVTQDVEKGISTDEYPDLPGGCGSVDDYTEKIARVLLDNKQITKESIGDIFRGSPKGERVLKAISKDEPSGDVDKCAKTIYDTLLNIHKKLPPELGDRLEEYRKQDNELYKRFKQTEIELTKFINEHM